MVSHPAALDPPRVCPKYGWEYPFLSTGFVRRAGAEAELRFRVYCQSRRRLPAAVSVNRALLRLWSLVDSRLGLDHARPYGRLVEVFLTEGGDAGGEQGIFFGPGPDGQPRSHNTIYIYHLSSFDGPVEKAREVAHEYGHAVLPAIGGFEAPEEWGNGSLGERLFLMWLAEELASGALKPEDAMGAEADAVAAWVRDRVLPLSDRVWLNGPDLKLLKSKGPEAMDEYLGVMLMAAQAFPDAMPRAVLLSGGVKAMDALRGVLRATEERETWEVRVPERLRGREVWLPLPGRWEFEGAEELERKGDWVKVRPGGATVTAVKWKGNPDPLPV